MTGVVSIDRLLPVIPCVSLVFSPANLGILVRIIIRTVIVILIVVIILAYCNL